jgi:hypothetical protein
MRTLFLSLGLGTALVMGNAVAAEKIVGNWTAYGTPVPTGYTAVLADDSGTTLLCRVDIKGIPAVGTTPVKSKACRVQMSGKEYAYSPFEILLVQSTTPASATAAVTKPNVRHGVTAQGIPFAETLLADGTIRRVSKGSITIISPNGKGNTMYESQAPGGTPPATPNDPQALRWFDTQNGKLLAIIERLLGTGTSDMTAYQLGEDQSTGGNTVNRIVYRIDAVNTLTSQP